MRRITLLTLLSGLAAVLAACALQAPAPKTIFVSEARLAQLISSQFPFRSEMLEVLEIDVSAPRITLDPANNRINTSLDLKVAGNSLLGLFTRKQYQGGIDLSYGLRFEPGDGSVRLNDVRVQRFSVSGTPDALQRYIERLGAPLAQKLLKDYRLYTVRPEDLQAAQGWGYAPGVFRIDPAGLSITLDPVARK